jgi:DNA invertase Pin-like site-specific DNA recombinase
METLDIKIPTLKEYFQQRRTPTLLPKIAKPPKLTAEQKEQIKQLRMEGMKLEWLGMEFGVSHMTIYRIVKNINKVK